MDRQVVEEGGVGADGVGRLAKDSLVPEVVHETRGESGGRCLIPLHRVGDEDRIAPAQLHRVAARDLRPAGHPAKRRVHGLVHRHDDGVDVAGGEEEVEVGEHR